MVQKFNKNRFFIRSYPLLLTASLLFGLVLFYQDWPPGFAVLNRVFECQLILILILGLLHLFKPVPGQKKYLWAGLSWSVIWAAWGSQSWLLPQAAAPGQSGWLSAGPLFLRGSIGFFILGLWAGCEQAIRLEEQRNSRILNRLADQARVTESHLTYLKARIEPEFLLRTLQGIHRLREPDMKKAAELQKILVAYLKQSLAVKEPGVAGEKKDLKNDILRILETP